MCFLTSLWRFFCIFCIIILFGTILFEAHLSKFGIMDKLNLNKIILAYNYEYEETERTLTTDKSSFNNKGSLKCLPKPSDYMIDSILKDPFKKSTNNSENPLILQNVLNTKYWDQGTFLIDNMSELVSERSKRFKSYVPIFNYLIKKRRPNSHPSLCNFCGKTFTRPWLLQGHVRTHTGERPFKCSICGKTFADKSNLRAHIQTHSTVKPFQCSKCCRCFSLKSYLAKHKASSCDKKLNKCTK